MNLDARVAALVRTWTGIDVPRCAGQSLSRFIDRRLSELGLPTLEPYLGRIASVDSAEFERLVNAITVTYTWFYRDPDQLTVVGELLRQRAPSKVRVWIPGCSTGEDAYSVALVAERVGADVEILATDVNSSVLEQAVVARYSAWAVRDVPESQHRRFTRKRDGQLELDDAIRRRVRFARHNLLDRPPEPEGGGQWDVILCRNVLIYFTSEGARATLSELGRALAHDGHILLGASEIVLEAPDGLMLDVIGDRMVLRRALGNRPRTPDPKPFSALSTPMPLPAAVPEPLELSRELGAILPPVQPLESHSPDVASAHGRLIAGIGHYVAGEVEAALEAFRSSLFLEPALWPAGCYLGLCYETLGLPRQALREYRSATEQAAQGSGGELESRIGPLYGWTADLRWIAEQRARALSGGASARPRTGR